MKNNKNSNNYNDNRIFNTLKNMEENYQKTQQIAPLDTPPQQQQQQQQQQQNTDNMQKLQNMLNSKNDSNSIINLLLENFSNNGIPAEKIKLVQELIKMITSSPKRQNNTTQKESDDDDSGEFVRTSDYILD